MQVSSAALVFVVLAHGVAMAQAPPFDSCSFYSRCPGDSIVVTFEGYDVGGDPEHVGYDVYRSTVADCGDPMRVNEQPLSRVIDDWYLMQVVDRNVVEGTLYRYQIYDVDAQRTILGSGCFMPGSNVVSYRVCGTAPVTHGTIVDWKWTVHIEPCDGSCYQSAFLEYGDEELRPYVGRDALVYGSLSISTDGFSIGLERFDLVPCSVAVDGSAWGNIKSLYR